MTVRLPASGVAGSAAVKHEPGLVEAPFARRRLLDPEVARPRVAQDPAEVVVGVDLEE